MSREVYRYAFERETPFTEVLATLELALIAVEALHGEPRTRMDARFVNDPEKRSVVIDASTPVGQSLNQIFTGYVEAEFGDDAFTVERVDRVPEAAPEGAAA